MFGKSYRLLWQALAGIGCPKSALFMSNSSSYWATYRNILSWLIGILKTVQIYVCCKDTLRILLKQNYSRNYMFTADWLPNPIGPLFRWKLHSTTTMHFAAVTNATMPGVEWGRERWEWAEWGEDGTRYRSSSGRKKGSVAPTKSKPPPPGPDPPSQINTDFIQQYHWHRSELTLGSCWNLSQNRRTSDLLLWVTLQQWKRDSPIGAAGGNCQKLCALVNLPGLCTCASKVAQGAVGGKFWRGSRWWMNQTRRQGWFGAPVVYDGTSPSFLVQDCPLLLLLLLGLRPEQ